MAAFHPETLRLLRKTLADLNTQHKNDLARLAKLHIESRSLMAEKLRNRIADSVPVMRDLERILPPVHDAGPAPELDKRAQLLADGHALLDYLEANPDVPLNLAIGLSVNYYPLRDDDDEQKAAVNAVANLLGVPVMGPDSSHHYEAEIRFGSAKYAAIAVLSDYRERADAIDRLGKAALAATAEAGEPA